MIAEGELTSLLPLAKVPNSARSRGGGTVPLDARDMVVLGVLGTLASSGLWRESIVLNVDELLSPRIAALSRWEPLSARRRMLKNPSSGVTSVDDLLELTWDDLSSEGDRLLHAATMLRTELSGERGDACGRLSEVA